MPNNLTRNQYLSAMGIDVWVTRDTNNLDEQSPDVTNADNSDSDKSSSNESKLDINAIKKLVSDNSSNDIIDKAEIEINADKKDVSHLDWNSLYEFVNQCQDCELLKNRKNCVFGSGNINADLFIVGSSPSLEEDNSGQELIGVEGELLENMLRVLNLTRKDVYSSNLIKCASQNYREFSNLEMQNCQSYIERQINLVNPKVIIIFGEQPAQFILKTDKNLLMLSSQMHDYLDKDILVVVMEHPEQLLKSTEGKRQAMLNLFQIKSVLS
jgi:DNA polymerase